jgi:hypothetical protein
MPRKSPRQFNRKKRTPSPGGPHMQWLLGRNSSLDSSVRVLMADGQLAPGVDPAILSTLAPPPEELSASKLKVLNSLLKSHEVWFRV